jgi:hypothetical protein
VLAPWRGLRFLGRWLMKTELFTLCDYAADYGGKLSVIGIFDALSSNQLPAVHPHCALAVKMRFENIEEGPKRLRISLVDDDGKLIFPAIENVINVVVPPGIQSVAVNIVLNIERLTLERYGEYSIDLAIDGRHEGSIPLFFRRLG